MKQKSRSFLVVVCLLSAAFPLSSCTQIASLFNNDNTKTAHARHTKSHPNADIYDADAYVSNLELSRLTLMAHPENTEDVSGYVSVINGYAVQKKHKAEKLTLIVMDYKMNGDSSVQEIVAPVTTTKTDFASLQAIMDKLGTMSGTLHSFHLVTVTVRPDASLALPKDTGSLMPPLEQLQKNLMSQSHSLDIADDIRTQLALIDFFTKQHCQDAAYLSVDNVKRLLGVAGQKKSLDEATLQNFSKDLETREGNLKEALPYKF